MDSKYEEMDEDSNKKATIILFRWSFEVSLRRSNAGNWRKAEHFEPDFPSAGAWTSRGALEVLGWWIVSCFLVDLS